jgi:hypothetical protein
MEVGGPVTGAHPGGWRLAIGVLFLQQTLAGFITKHGPPKRVSPTRYRIGLVMFTRPVLLAWLGPYLARHIPGFHVGNLAVLMTMPIRSRAWQGWLAVPLGLLVATASQAVAQDGDRAGLRMPPRSFALPMEIERDFGASDGDATIIRIMPLYSLRLNDAWRLVNLTLITLADVPGGVPGRPVNPNPVRGEAVFGLSDLIHTGFFTPEGQSGFIWGAGFILSLPTATDEVLGSGKWAVGPAIRLTYRRGPWNLGAVTGQRWSFAGQSSRPELNALLVRGTTRCRLSGGWYFIYAPIIVANWNAPSSQRWVVPVGGGLGKSFELHGRLWAASVQAYHNAIRPDAAPDWALRLQIVAAIPF